MTGLLARRRIAKQAGASAARLYERHKREWRARNRGLFAGLTVAVGVVLVFTLLLAWPHLWIWFAGVCAGGVLALYLAVLESPPPWIEGYLVGSIGEERTAKALAPLLNRGWLLRHDLDRWSSNLDHVVIGPGGVFVLDTKNLHGSVLIDGDVLSLTRPGAARPAYATDKWAAGARRQGRDLHGLLRQRCGLGPWVTAVVVLWADFPQRVAVGRNVTYVHGDALVDWLSSQSARLNAKQINQLATALAPGQRRQSRQPAEATAQP